MIRNLFIVLLFFSFFIDASETKLRIKYEQQFDFSGGASISYLSYTPNGEFLIVSSNLANKVYLLSNAGDMKTLNIEEAIDENRVNAADKALYFFAARNLHKISNQGELTIIPEAELPSSYGLDISPSGHYMLSSGYQLLKINALAQEPEPLGVYGFHPRDDFAMGYQVVSMQRDTSTWLFDKSELQVWSLSDAELINKIEVSGIVKSHKVLNEEYGVLMFNVDNEIQFWDYKKNELLDQPLRFEEEFSFGKWSERIWLATNKELYEIQWQDNHVRVESKYQTTVDELVNRLGHHNFSKSGRYALLEERRGDELSLKLYDLKDQPAEITTLPNSEVQFTLNPAKREIATYDYKDDTLRVYAF
tara:strand:+ start:778 stop:1863 length:1086 start_codon:yes stop_codon:yes gene_type:complete